MEELTRILSEQLEKLNYLIGQAEKSLVKAPEGILRISKCKNSLQYYRRANEKDAKGTYIKKKEQELICRLAQKDYDEKFLKAAKMRKNDMQKALQYLLPDKLNEFVINQPKERLKLIKPYVITDERYAERWQERQYTGKGFAEEAPEIYTEKGERVRSKSEKILADKFKLMGIPYLYEYPIKLKGYGVVYPDFLVLNKRTRKEYYWEHLGQMDNEEYCEKAVEKIDTYHKNGILQGDKLLLTYETSKKPLQTQIVESMINKFLI